MKLNSIYYSTSFKKSVNKYSSHRQKIEKAINKFIKNPFELSLKTHKLSGKLSGYWSFSVDYQIRILFEFLPEKSVGLIDIGTHGIYK